MIVHHIFHELLLPLSSSDEHTKLNFQPTELSLVDISILIVLLLLRSVFHSLGAGLFGSPKDVSSRTPNITLSMPLQLSKAHLDRYAMAVDPEESGHVDMNNPQLLLFLSSITEPATLLLLAKSGCPIRPLGSVNVRNRFELLRTDGKPCPLLEANDAVITASLRSAPRVVKRGLEYDIETTLSLPDPESRQKIPIFRQIFTMLQFMKVEQPATKLPEKQTLVTSSAARLPVNIGFDEPSYWAAICKDYNLIHISALAAKAYGFPGKIAHGNHVVAKALHVLADRSKDSASLLGKMSMPIWMEVSFRRPMPVPAQLELRIMQRSEARTIAGFEVMNDGKVCIEGALGMMSK